MNMQDMMVFRETGSRTADRYLMPYEHRVIALRAHPAVLLPRLLEVIGGLLLAGLVDARLGLTWIWWLWLVVVARLVWKVIAWSVEFFAVTDQRVMLITGVLNRNVGMMPLTKVTDIALHRSPTGQLLGFGTFVLESAGQDQAIREINHVPYPEQIYLEISSAVFGAEDESPD